MFSRLVLLDVLSQPWSKVMTPLLCEDKLQKYSASHTVCHVINNQMGYLAIFVPWMLKQGL